MCIFFIIIIGYLKCSKHDQMVQNLRFKKINKNSNYSLQETYIIREHVGLDDNHQGHYQLLSYHRNPKPFFSYTTVIEKCKIFDRTNLICSFSRKQDFVLSNLLFRHVLVAFSYEL